MYLHRKRVIAINSYFKFKNLLYKEKKKACNLTGKTTKTQQKPENNDPWKRGNMTSETVKISKK